MQQEIFPDSKVCWAPEHFPKASSRTGISIPWLICQGHINTKSMVWRTCSHKGRDRIATLFSAFAFIESKVPLTEHKDEILGKRESQKSQKSQKGASGTQTPSAPTMISPWAGFSCLAFSLANHTQKQIWRDWLSSALDWSNFSQE